MIGVIGVRPDIEVKHREKLSIIQKHIDERLKSVNKICDEAVIISTCNRTEIYYSCNRTEEDFIKEMFKCLGWNIEYIPLVFNFRDQEVVKHLMEVVCGFDSALPGEDQILGQVKNAYERALKLKTVKSTLQRLFQIAVTCGKEFRTKAGLYRIPVSSASMVVREARSRGKCRYMLLGYGEMGMLVARYILQDDFDILYIAVRNSNSIEIKDEKVKTIPFADRKKYYSDVDCIISATSAPHTVVTSEDLPDRNLLVFDMSVPRDVDEDVYKLKNVEVFNIDRIGRMNDENNRERKEIMQRYRYMLDEYIEEFNIWQDLRGISPYIQDIKNSGEKVFRRRYNTFLNKKKSKDINMLAETLLKSTSDAYINRAIEVLKDEYLNGRGEECIRIIQRIFTAAI